jgi:hypothetical protein
LFWFTIAPDLARFALGPPRPLSPAEDDVSYAIGHAVRAHDGAAINYFVNTLLALPAYLSRVEEDVEIKGRKLLVRAFLRYRNG